MKNVVILFLMLGSVLYAQVKFDANFPSGNLNTVTTTDSVTYYVTTNEDIGGRWFYFRIAGVKDRFIRVKVTNSDVKRAMYSYDDKTYNRFTVQESPQMNVFEKTFEEDTVFVSYYTPYTLSYLDERIEQWSISNYFSVSTIGMTDNNLPIKEFTITDPFTPLEEKSVVWIHARTHPGETPSSYHFDGIVTRLLENDEFAEYLRKNVEFHLIPTTNPDGVFYGRSRTNFNGIDVESNWDKPDATTSTEVRLLKNRMAEICFSKVFSIMLNLHSIASPSCTFYVHTAASTSPSFYRRQYQLTYLNTSNNPYFAQEDIEESTLRPVFPEGWLWANYNDTPVAITYETPYDYYSSDEVVTNENLYELGYKTVCSIYDFLELSFPLNQTLDNKNAVTVGPWTTNSTGIRFFSDNFYYATAGTGNSEIIYTSESMPAGEYAVFGWWPENNYAATNTKFTILNNGEETAVEKSQRIDGANWNYIADVKVKNPGQIQIKINNSADGYVIADAFKIIYKGEISGVDEIKQIDYVLNQNYPNPFNPSTQISFSLPKSEFVSLKIYDVLGKEVATLINEEQNAGHYTKLWNASGLSSGVYFYRLQAGKYTETKKMILVR